MGKATYRESTRGLRGRRDVLFAADLVAAVRRPCDEADVYGSRQTHQRKHAPVRILGDRLQELGMSKRLQNMEQVTHPLVRDVDVGLYNPVGRICVRHQWAHMRTSRECLHGRGQTARGGRSRHGEGDAHVGTAYGFRGGGGERGRLSASAAVFVLRISQAQCSIFPARK